jgi:hypothetical protein
MNAAGLWIVWSITHHRNWGIRLLRIRFFRDYLGLLVCYLYRGKVRMLCLGFVNIYLLYQG